MANAEQLAILKQGANVWNAWRAEHRALGIDLSEADLSEADLNYADLGEAIDINFQFVEADADPRIITELQKRTGDNTSIYFIGPSPRIELRQVLELGRPNLRGANFSRSKLNGANLSRADLSKASLSRAHLRRTNLGQTIMAATSFSKAEVGGTFFGSLDLSEAMELGDVIHHGPSSISTDTFALSKGKIHEIFLRGCGLSDADIEYSKLSNPDLSNEEVSKILYKMYDLRATQALQISPLFVSYSHADSEFVDRIGTYLTKKGIRFWRDIHNMRSGRIEKQIDSAIRQNPTVLLVLSEHSLASDWVEHEVRMARGLEKEMGRDVLCPVALDDSWKNSPWPKRLMEQIMEYNILDFSAWHDDSKFDDMFRRLIDGLGLFYKG